MAVARHVRRKTRARTGSALSDALVDMRDAFSRAVAEHVIHGDTRHVLIRTAKKRYLPDRTYDSTIRLAENMVPRVELSRLRINLPSSRVLEIPEKGGPSLVGKING